MKICSLTGLVMDTNSAEWRHECECRYVARLMWRGNESEYLELVEKARGKVAADSLRDRAREIVREHKKGV